MLALFVFAVGASVGSFLNVVADRVPDGRSLVSPRSRCSSCNRPLSTWKLVPILSYLWLRGRCRHCGAAIPARLMVVEAATGALFTAAYLRYGLGVELVLICAVVALFLAVAIIDFEHRLILNRIVFPSLVVSLALAPFWTELGLPRTFFGDSSMLGFFLNSMASGVGAFLLFLLVYVVYPLVYVVYPRGFGAGDVKLAGLMGMLLGFPGVLIALWAGIFGGGVVAIALIAARLKGRKDAMPFGPFLSVAGIAVLLVGADSITSWYLDLVRSFAGV